MKKTKMGPIQIWGEKVGWKKRVKAICKPCWEIKYCPFGPIVEDFPITLEPTEKSCRIFGHDCPVFYTAEPFTETKELRNIGRKVTRTTQFRVLKRDNQICAVCGNPVKDADIEFDHIIPWAKGGSSDEHNIELLCTTCNKKKGKKFEDKHLINSLSDHLIESAPFEILICILEFIKLHHKVKTKNKIELTSLDICKFFGRRKVTRPDEAGIEIVKDICKFFNLEKQNVIKDVYFRALKYRWGFADKNTHKLLETAKKFNINAEELLLIEADLLNHLGWSIKLSKTTKKKWLKS